MHHSRDNIVEPDVNFWTLMCSMLYHLFHHYVLAMVVFPTYNFFDCITVSSSLVHNYHR
jgi:hypothetical protein